MSRIALSAAKKKETDVQVDTIDGRQRYRRRCRHSLSPEDKPDMSKMIAMIKRENWK